MAPILPGLSDRPELLERGRARGARGRRLRRLGEPALPQARGRASTSSTALAEDCPEQLPAYERLYAQRAYLGAAETKPVRELVSELTRKHGIRDRRTTRLAPAPEPEQLALTL